MYGLFCTLGELTPHILTGRQPFPTIAASRSTHRYLSSKSKQIHWHTVN